MKVESWGKYPKSRQTGQCVHWPQELIKKRWQANGEMSLPFGNGRSYGDVCLSSSGQVLVMSGLNRFKALDLQSGRVRVEAGMTLGDILAVVEPKGWFLPVVPGTSQATVGGAIANDVHGKNHHVRGTFGCHVHRLWLWRDGRCIECSTLQNPDLFAATIGGLGLTGIILEAELALVPVTSGCVEMITHRFDRLSDFFDLAERYDQSHEYGVAWVDCQGKASSLGRGVYFAGNHATDDVGIPARKTASKRYQIPFTPPLSLINRLSLTAFNEIYWRSKPSKPVTSRVGCSEFFFPLDGILNWNRLYGREGFQQYQCVIPEDNAQDAMKDILAAISRSGMGSFLAVLKQCGNQDSPGLLSFPLKGTSLALDFPCGRKLSSLFNHLDDITRAANGRLYPAKDAHMRAADFQRAYPEWSTLEQLRDPSLESLFWKRVTA